MPLYTCANISDLGKFPFPKLGDRWNWALFHMFAGHWDIFSCEVSVKALAWFLLSFLPSFSLICRNILHIPDLSTLCHYVLPASLTPAPPQPFPLTLRPPPLLTGHNGGLRRRSLPLSTAPQRQNPRHLFSWHPHARHTVKYLLMDGRRRRGVNSRHGKAMPSPCPHGNSYF